MEINAQHRRKLVDQLSELIKEKSSAEDLLIHFEGAEKKAHLIPSQEVTLWLVTEQIRLVRLALINNELENF